MAKSADRKPMGLAQVCATLTLVLSVAMVAPAQARGIVADENTPTTISGCQLASCTTPLTFGGASIYVYSDGVISFGSALTGATAGDLSTFGNAYIAAGLFDYAASGLNMTVQSKLAPFDSNTLELFWIFSSSSALGVPPNPSQAVFGIYLKSLGGGAFEATVGSGLANVTWFNASQGYSPYCDTLCDTQSNDPNNVNNVVYGAYLPDGALIGTSFSGTRTETDVNLENPVTTSYDGSPVTVNGAYPYPTYILDFTLRSTAAVPEPGAWSMMLFGLCALGVVVGRLRRRQAMETAD